MGKRGIMQHGTIKSFLTRGAFRSVFKPVLYKKEDYVHHDFLQAFSPIASGLNFEDKQGRWLVYWLVNVPKELFEVLFIKNESGEYYLTAVKDSDLKNGHLCAYYTQAFVLWHLEQILKNNEEFSSTVGISMEFVEYILQQFYGTKNLTMQYLNEIRAQFDQTSMKVDPRDWGIIYVYNIYDLLINDEQVKNNSISDWDKDLTKKFNFIEFIMVFFTEKKEDLVCQQKTRQFF